MSKLLTPEDLNIHREEHKGCDPNLCATLVLLSHIDALEERNAKMREALEWYAAESTYEGDRRTTTPVVADEGKIARAALREEEPCQS